MTTIMIPLCSHDLLAHPDTSDTDSELEQKVLYLGRLFLASNLLAFILTVIPVVAEFGDVPSSPHDNWYVYNDIFRLIEPIVAMPFQVLILCETNIFGPFHTQTRGNLALLVMFCISAALYQQGAGFHSASNMFKHAVESVRTPESVAAYPLIEDVYDWIRDLWEHLVSHYMYAGAGILISWVNAYKLRNLVIPKGPRRNALITWVLAAVVYGLIVGSVAAQFIKGSIVALCLIFVYGFGVLGTFLHTRNDGWILGKRIVIQYYLLSYCIALVITIGWMSVNGLKSRND